MLPLLREWGEDVIAGAPRPDQIRDRVITRLQTGRTVAALGSTVWLLMSYPLAEGHVEFVLGKLVDVVAAFAILCVACLLSVTIFIAAARPPLRRLYVGRLKGPRATLRHMLTGVGLLGGVGWLLFELMRGELIPWDTIYSYGALATVATVLLLLLAVPCCLGIGAYGAFAFLVSAWYALGSCFRLADVHETLPALVSPALVWSLFVMNYLDGPEVAAPPLVFYTFLLGGPLSVTALSLWEIRRLRHRYGVTMRSALGRSAARQPTYAPHAG